MKPISASLGWGILALLLLVGCGGEPKKDDSKSPNSKQGGADRSPDKDSPKPKQAADGPKRHEIKDIFPELKLDDRKTDLRFEAVAAKANLKHEYRNGREAKHATMVESLGGGGSTFDFDRDGMDDYFGAGGGSFGEKKELIARPPQLFLHTAKLSFEPCTDSSFVTADWVYNHGAYGFDYNNDGFPDLLVTGYGGLKLFENLGDGTFAEVTKEAGLDDTSWSSSAAWGDVNGDGFLDLMVLHYVNWSFDNHPICFARQGNELVPLPTKTRETCAPRTFKPLPDILYLNQGDGTFRDATKECGINKFGRGLGVMMIDVDNDQDLDIYIANDTDANLLYRNKGDGTFEELGILSGASHDANGNADGSMGLDIGDFNGDGRFDIMVTNFQGEFFGLYQNQGNARFLHVSDSRGMTSFEDVYVGWGTTFSDFDSDGDEDMFVTNGHVQLYPVNATIKQFGVLLENVDSSFHNVTSASESPYLKDPHEGRSVAVSDIDQDGDLDMFVLHVNEPVELLINTTKSDNSWLQLRLIGTQSTREPIGAIVKVKVGDKVIHRQFKGASSYLARHTEWLHFGLGKVVKIDSIEIQWPSGATQQVKPAINTRLTITEK